MALTLFIPGEGGGCFPSPGQQIAQNSKTKQAITLNLDDFSEIKIFKVINQRKTFLCCHSNQFAKSNFFAKISKHG